MKNVLKAFLYLMAFGFIFTACSSKVDFDRKTDHLKSENIFGENGQPIGGAPGTTVNNETFDDGFSGNSPGGDFSETFDGRNPFATDPNVPNSPGNPNGTGNTNTNDPFAGLPGGGGGGSNGTGGGYNIPIDTLCSEEYAYRTRGHHVRSSLNLRLDVFQNGNRLCRITDTNALKWQIIDKHINIPPHCMGGLSAQEFANRLDLTQQGSSSKDFDIKLFANNGTGWVKINQPRKESGWTRFYPNTILYDGTLNHPHCSQTVSPLFVDLRTQQEKQMGSFLTSPQQGQFFDILGENTEKYIEGLEPHTPVKISWFQSPNLKFIAMPNEDGEVQGINQLFGDNTKGPDGDFAKNGFHALAKFDHSKDGIIDKDDPVYHKLVLWSDVVNKGTADPGELSSLAQENIVFIDLNYDPNFYERDIYGNEIKFKSILGLCVDNEETCDQMINGSMPVDYKLINNGKIDVEYKTVFDVWFTIPRNMEEHLASGSPQRRLHISYP